MALEPIIIIVSFVDLCVFSIGPTQFLIVIERKNSMQKTSDGIQLEETNWHVFTNPPMHKSAQEIQLFTPSIGALDAAVHSGTLWAAVETNYKHAAYLLKWNIESTDPLRITQFNFLPIEIPKPIMASVQIPPKQDWSTTSLPSYEWLFNPHLAIVGENPAICLNTADARALLMQYSPFTRSFTVLFDREGLVEPVALSIEQKITLLGRKVNKPWSVFFNTRRYSTAKGPILLPLGYFDGARNVEVNLSKEFGLEPAYLFDVVELPSGRKVLSMISGLKEKPTLSMVVFNQERNKWIVASKIELPSMPIRCKLSVNDKGMALVAAAFKEKTGYVVHSWTVETGKI